MTVSALVVSFHTGPCLKECLYALLGEPGISEIVVADHGNPQNVMDWLDDFAAAHDIVRILRKGDNPGFGTGVNRAAGLACGTHLLILNPDAIVRRGAVKKLIAALSGAPSPAIAGGRIFDVNGDEERGCRRNTLTLAGALGLSKWTLEKDPPPPGPIRVGAISGAFFVISKTDFDSLNGFDESYFIHFEDLDLCRRANEAGGAVIYVPDAGALHYGSTSKVPSAFVRDHKAKSLARYLRKFAKGAFEKLAIEIAAPLMGLAFRLKR